MLLPGVVKNLLRDEALRSVYEFPTIDNVNTRTEDFVIEFFVSWRRNSNRNRGVRSSRTSLRFFTLTIPGTTTS